jgi:hypothetical protein
VLFSHDEGSGDRVHAAASIFENVESYVRSRSDAELRQTVGLEYHHFGKTLALRREDYAGALQHARAGLQIARERGDKKAELIALRCLSCVQAEVLSPELVPVAERLYQLVGRIDEQFATLSGDSINLETRIHNLLVAEKIRLHAGLLDGEYRNTLDKANQIVAELESRPTAELDQLRRVRALVDAYEVAWDVWVKQMPPDAASLRRIGAWVREDGRADYCLIRWPVDRRPLLSRAAAAAQMEGVATRPVQLPAKEG